MWMRRSEKATEGWSPLNWKWRIPPFAEDVLEVPHEAAEERVARAVPS